MDWIDFILIPLVKVVIIFTVMVLSVPIMVLLERKIIGRIQQRPGPNRVGKWGILQTIVDGIKLLLKEDFIPPKADRITFALAPVLALVPALLTITIVPFGPSFDVEIEGKMRTISLGLTDLPVGILFYLAITSIGVYGIVLAGWSSNSKYSLLGGIRSSAQLISYELTLGMSLVGVLLIAGSFETRKLVESQTAWGILSWHVFRQPLAFLMFLVAGFAETNRLPFDLPEGETELGAGFHTEYSSLKWAMFMMAEYMNILSFSAIMTTLFLGGFHGPFPLPLGPMATVVSGLFWFSVKVGALFFFYVWVRGTLPRLRYDQLMNVGWKYLFPTAVANMMATAGILALGLPAPIEGIALAVAGAGLIWGLDRISIEQRKRVLSHVA